MTPAQRRTLAYIHDYIVRRGHSPSLQEIAIGTGLGAASKGAAHGLVEKLIGRGYLEREPGASARGLRLTQAGREMLGLDGVAVDLSAVSTAALVAELGRRAHG